MTFFPLKASENEGCASGLCECDLEAANCFKGKEYNIELKNIDKETSCTDDEDEEKSKKEEKKSKKRQKNQKSKVKQEWQNHLKN